MTTVRQSLNNGNPNSIAVGLKEISAGEAFSLLARTVRAQVVDHVLDLPEDARAVRIELAYGMGTTDGYKAPLAIGDADAPATGEVTIQGDGKILFATADAITEALVTYYAAEGQVHEDVVDVVNDVATLLAGRKARLLLSAERLAGDTAGATTVVNRPATPTAGQSAIGGGDDATVVFAAADGVTKARIRYVAIPSVGSTRRSLAESLAFEIGAV